MSYIDDHPPHPQHNNVDLPKGSAVAGMVCGIVSIVLCYVPILGLVLGIVGTAISAQTINAVKRGEAGGKGMAITGLVCGIVGLVWSTVYTFVWIAIFG